MSPTPPGYVLWEYTSPVLTVAASPLLGPWLEATGFSQIVPFFAFSGGTSTAAIDGSFDGSTADADFAYTAPTSGTAFTVVSPWIRFKVTQTVADATKTKILLRTRA
jgi:hypothetical protein